MSRIGKQPVSLPAGVKVELATNRITVNGPKGKLDWSWPERITVQHDSAKNQLLVTRQGDLRADRALHGMSRALLANMVTGVTKGYGKVLDVIGVGYSAKVQGPVLELMIGFSNPIRLSIPAGIKVDIKEKPLTISLSGPDKQAIGQFAADIRKVRPPEPYNGKGIKYSDEIIRRKAGKAFAGSAGGS